MEDAANDPTLHSVSNSWGFGGEAEWGARRSVRGRDRRTSSRSPRRPGRRFYFSTGDSGTYQSGYPTDSPYVVSVGGTSTYSTSNPGDVEHDDDVERRRQLVLERRSRARPGRPAPASRRTRRARAA